MSEEKTRALAEIRRRIATTADRHRRAELLVLEKAVTEGPSFEAVGQIIDISGEVLGYAFGLPCLEPELVSDPTTYIWVKPIGGGTKAFSRYAKGANDAVKLDEHEKEARLKLIYAYLGIGV